MRVVHSLYYGQMIVRRDVDQPDEPAPRTHRSMAEIIADVAARHNLKISELKGEGRQRHIAWPRQEAMAEMYATGRFSTPQIGRALGGRDHSTIIHGIRQHKARADQQATNSPVVDRDCRSDRYAA